jgi:hypothetical protein
MLSMTLVAASSSTITMTPSSWAKNTDKSVSLTVTNSGTDVINMIEILVPKDSNLVPLYSVDINGITTPQGWTFTTTGSPINKVTWVATGSGLAGGSSLGLFGLQVRSPSVSGNYQWSWTTTDSKNVKYSGTTTTTVGQAPVSSFVLASVPVSTVAGNSFKITVRAYGDDGQAKADYTGTVKFTSTDVNAVLPSDYTFTTSDAGVKQFSIAYKTSGSQSFTVKDGSAGVFIESAKTTVAPGAAIDIGLNPADKTVSAGDSVEFKVLAKDALGNIFEVTDKSTIKIENGAGGSWVKNVYTAGNQGTWALSASYNSLISLTKLTVGKATTTPTTPTQGGANVSVTQPVEVTSTTPADNADVTVTAPESVSIAPGSNDTMIVSVNNNKDSVLSSVSIKVDGIPSDWVSTYPLTNDVPAKGSKDYLVIIVVPANESGTKTIEFKAQTNQGAVAVKNASLVISTTPTGAFSLPKNVLQLGVVIIAVAAVVIIGWELWFKKPKSK